MKPTKFKQIFWSLTLVFLFSSLLSACQSPTMATEPTITARVVTNTSRVVTSTPLTPALSSTPTKNPTRTATATRTRFPTYTKTALPPPTRTPTQTRIPTQSLTPSSTPPPGPLALSVSNAHQVEQLVVWGKGSLRTALWSPDGRILFLATSLGVHLYNAATLQEVRFIATGENTSRLALSPDGLTLVTADKDVKLWNTVTGQHLGTLPGTVAGWFSYLEFSPGGTMIAALGLDGPPGDPPSKLFVWDTASRQIRYIKDAVCCGHGNHFTFSPDGKKIAYTVCGYGYFIKASTGEDLFPSAPDIESTITTFTPDGKYALMGSNVVDVETGQIIRTLEGNPGYYTRVFTPDGKTLILAGVWNGKLDVYETQFRDFETDEVRLTIPSSGSFQPHSLRPDGRELAAIKSGAVLFYDVDTGAVTRQIDWESGTEAITFGTLNIGDQANKLVLLAGNYRGQVQLYDPYSGRMMQTLSITDSPILDIAVHPDGNRLGVTTIHKKDVSLLIYNLRTGSVEQTISVPMAGYTDGTWGLAFSQDGEAVLVGTSLFMNHDAWNIQTGEIIREPARKTWLNAYDLGAAPNGHLISVDYKQKQIVDGNTGQVLSSFADLMDVGLCSDHRTNQAVSADGRFYILGCDMYDIHVWDLAKQKPAYSLAGHQPSIGDGFFGNVTDIAISPYGYLLASSGYDSTLRFWDVSTGKLLVTIKAHTARVSNLVFSPDGRFLATAGCDGTLRLWGLRHP